MNKSYVLSKLFNHAKILRFKEYINKNSRFQIIFIYNIMLTTLLLVLSPLIPFILNYPPGFKEASKALNSSYFQKQIIFLIVSAVLSSIFLMRSLRILHNWKNAVKNADYEKITSIRTKCLAAPYKIYFLQIALFTAIVGVLIFAFTVTHKSAVYFRIVLMIFSFMSLFSLVIFVLTNRVFKQILVETFNGHVLQGQRIGLRSKIFLQIAPIFISTILLTSMIGYSRLIEEKGDLYAQIFMDALENKLKYVSVNASQDDIWKALSTITYSEDNFTTFLITPENNIVTSDNQKLNSIMLYYIEKLKHAFEGRFYDMTCETQGVIKKITIGNNYYTTGIKFNVASQKTVIFFLITFFVLLLFCVINLFSFSKSIVSEISIVANALSKIAEDEKVNLDQKIPVTSNDEIGELIVSFSKIQELTKANIKSINDQQTIILEKERLASLGQMIGGIAHNLNSPIMSMACMIDNLKKLADEYKDSIGDSDVTKEDHLEIAKEMIDCIDKISPQCSYMSNIISNVKLQAVKLNQSSSERFTIDELIKTLNIKSSNRIHSDCLIIPQIQVDKNLEINGEINNLVQVLDNLILNACESYDGNEGSIDFTIRKENENIKFIIRDKGKGITDELKDRIFKEMVTTKGKHGTGIGLYMSYSTIKGRFGGDMWFENNEDRGVTFYIAIPITDN